jgi:uncharacterized protein YndB with AHSA1/START domain
MSLSRERSGVLVAFRWIGAVAAVVTLAGAEEASAEVKDAARSGFTVENVVEVPTDATTAWKALVEDVDRWWPADHTWWGEEGELSIEPKAGGCFCERHGDQQALHMMVIFVDPGRLLRLTGGLGPLQGMGLHGVMEFRLAPGNAAGSTRITMYYRAGGYTPDDLAPFAAVVDSVQALQLGGLRDYLSPSDAQP